MDRCFFDQPEKLPLVFHVDACMMAFDHAKNLLWYSLYSTIRELMNLPVHDKLLFDCYRCNCWYWRWDLHGLMLILRFPFTFMSIDRSEQKNKFVNEWMYEQTRPIAISCRLQAISNQWTDWLYNGPTDQLCNGPTDWQSG